MLKLNSHCLIALGLIDSVVVDVDVVEVVVGIMPFDNSQVIPNI